MNYDFNQEQNEKHDEEHGNSKSALVLELTKKKYQCKPGKRRFHRSNKPDAKSATNFSVQTCFLTYIDIHNKITLK